MHTRSPHAPSAFSAALLHRLSSPMAYFDVGLNCTFANEAYRAGSHLEAGLLEGTSLPTHLGPFAVSHWEAVSAQVLSGECCAFEAPSLGQGAALTLARWTVTPDLVEGRVSGFMVEVVDLSEMQQTKAELVESRIKFDQIADSSPLAIFRANAEGQVTYANAAWAEICGLEPSLGLNDGWRNAVYPDDRAFVITQWLEAVRKVGVYDAQHRVIRPDGQVRFVRAWAKPLTARSGHKAGFVGFVEDVTEQHLAAEQLRMSEALLDRTGRVASVGGWQLEIATDTLTWSTLTRRIHEVDADFEPTVQRAIQFYSPGDQATIAAAVQQALDRGKGFDLELPMTTAKGRAIWVRAFGEVDHLDGQAVRVIGALQDITESRQRRVELHREQALRSEIEGHLNEVKRLLHERNDMLDVLTHEVRQPLNNASAAIQSAATVFSEMGELMPTLRLARAQIVMTQVLAGIDNLLAVASLFSRPYQVHMVDTDMDAMIAVCIADMPVTERARIRVERKTSTRTASLDMSLSRLAIRNLLANSLKYSPPGSPVTVCLSDSDDPLAVVIEVMDGGPGISEALMARLFEKGLHKTASRAASGGSSGMGLGLYIVKRVMEMHRGEVSVVRNDEHGLSMRLMYVQD